MTLGFRFSERKKSQYRHDKGRINLSDKDKKWFNNLVKSIENYLRMMRFIFFYF